MYLSIKGFRWVSQYSLHCVNRVIALLPHLKNSVYFHFVAIKNSVSTRKVFDVLFSVRFSFLPKPCTVQEWVWVSRNTSNTFILKTCGFKDEACGPAAENLVSWGVSTAVYKYSEYLWWN